MYFVRFLNLKPSCHPDLAWFINRLLHKLDTIPARWTERVMSTTSYRWNIVHKYNTSRHMTYMVWSFVFLSSALCAINLLCDSAQKMLVWCGLGTSSTCLLTLWFFLNSGSKSSFFRCWRWPKSERWFWPTLSLSKEWSFNDSLIENQLELELMAKMNLTHLDEGMSCKLASLERKVMP